MSFMFKAISAFKNNENNTYSEKCVNSVLKDICFNFDIINKPDTYKTLLGSSYNESNCNIIRKKINKLIKNRMIMFCEFKKGKGKRRLFFTIEKKYFIVITKNNCFYCAKTKIKNNVLIMEQCKELNEFKWEDRGDYNVNLSEVVKCL